MEEKTFLNESGVTVTNTRYIFMVNKSPQTQAMSGITAVSEAKNLGGLPAAIILGIIGLLTMAGSFTAGLIILAIAAAIYYFFKPNHFVVTTSASGVSKGFFSKDKEFVQRIISALNESIISRG